MIVRYVASYSLPASERLQLSRTMQQHCRESGLRAEMGVSTRRLLADLLQTGAVATFDEELSTFTREGRATSMPFELYLVGGVRRDPCADALGGTRNRGVDQCGGDDRHTARHRRRRRCPPAADLHAAIPTGAGACPDPGSECPRAQRSPRTRRHRAARADVRGDGAPRPSSDPARPSRDTHRHHPSGRQLLVRRRVALRGCRRGLRHLRAARRSSGSAAPPPHPTSASSGLPAPPSERVTIGWRDLRPPRANGPRPGTTWRLRPGSATMPTHRSGQIGRGTKRRIWQCDRDREAR